MCQKSRVDHVSSVMIVTQEAYLLLLDCNVPHSHCYPCPISQFQFKFFHLIPYSSSSPVLLSPSPSTQFLISPPSCPQTFPNVLLIFVALSFSSYYLHVCALLHYSCFHPIPNPAPLNSFLPVYSILFIISLYPSCLPSHSSCPPTLSPSTLVLLPMSPTLFFMLKSHIPPLFF